MFGRGFFFGQKSTESLMSVQNVFLFKNVFSPLMFGVKGKQYKQNTSPKYYKIEIKILANLGLA